MIGGLGMSKDLSPVTKAVIFCPAARRPSNSLSSTGKEEDHWLNRDAGSGSGDLSPASQAIASGHLRNPQDFQHGASLEPSI